MSAIPIDMVRGKHLLAPETKITSAQQITASAKINIAAWQKLEWKTRLDQFVLKATDFDNNISWLSVSSGLLLDELSPEQIKNIAQARFTSTATVEQMALIQKPPFEVRHLSPPLYQVSFDDWIHTTFYLNPLSGEVQSVRSDLWRFYDFFWMLHIMDYQTRDDFNHPLVIAAAGVSLFFTVSGIVLLYFSLIKPYIKCRIYQFQQSRRTL
ncbi:MAG: hypothetical protein ACI88A_003144 [Paraglaciecola sp.]|jgi:hypothetical protein